MKKVAPVFIGLFASLLATGCVRNGVDTPHVSNDGAIHLDATTTRASVSTVTDMNSGFGVFAASGDVASTGAWYPGIDGSNNHVYSGGGWHFATPVPWPDDQTKYPMTFYAWYPVSHAGMNISAAPYNPSSATPMIMADITVGATAAEQTDILAARSTAAAEPVGSSLAMEFRHILSKIDFGIIPGNEATPEILALGLANVGNHSTYDMVNAGWTGLPDVSTQIVYDYYGTAISNLLGTGANPSGATAWSPGAGGDETTGVPFYTAPAADDRHLMLMPQTNPVWTSASAPDFGAGDGAFAAVLYRMTTHGGVDEVGYASARNHPNFAGGYEGPLYVLAAFPLPADANGDFTWVPGKGYRYNVGLGTPGSSNGYAVNDLYYDDTGNPTNLPLRDNLQIGDQLNDGVIHVTLGVGGWDDEAVDDLPKLYPVSATLNYDAVPNAGGTVKITSDVAGMIPITEAVEGQSVTFTLVPADPAATTFGAWYLGNNYVRLNTNDTHLNPITITMPGSPVTVDGYLGTFTPMDELTVPHDANGVNGAIWASDDLLNNGVFDGLHQISAGAFFQWGRDVPYENQGLYDVMFGPSPTMNPTPGYPQTPGSDQTGAAVWPEATDPCPDGWRLPTSGEWQRFRDATTDPLSGSTRPFYLTDNSDYILLNANGYITDQGLGIGPYDSNGNSDPLFGGYFWASDSNSGDNTRAPYFYWEGDTNPAALADDALKTNAYNVRCVKDIPRPETVTIGSDVWSTRNVGLFGTFTTSETGYSMLYQFGSAAMPAGAKVAWPGLGNPEVISSTNPGIGWPVENGGNGGAPVDAIYWGGTWSNTGGWAEENDPCPENYSVPSQQQWQDLLDNTTHGTAMDQVNGVRGRKFVSKTAPYDYIFLPISGSRSSASGLIASDVYGFYATSTPNNTTGAFALRFSANNEATFGSYSGRNAMGVRCVKDPPPPPPNPVAEVPIPSADGTYTTVWAGSNLSDTGVFATSATDDGVFFQWGRDVAYPYNYGSALPARDTDQTGNTTWPAATDPCPFGWHVPTYEEWQRFHDVMTDPETSGDRTFTSSYGNVTLPAAGYFTNGGTGGDQGTRANYWIGEQNSAEWAYIFEWVETSNMGSSGYQKTGAFSVRCVRTL